MNTDRLRFSFIIPNKLAGMSWPENVKPVADAVAYMKHQGVTTLVNTTISSYTNPVLENEFSVIHTAVANMTAPTTEQMDSIWRRYCELNDGEVMAVHCMHGLGRTGLVMACILGRSHDMGADEAMRRVREERPGSIESVEQEQFIHDYLARN